MFSRTFTLFSNLTPGTSARLAACSEATRNVLSILANRLLVAGPWIRWELCSLSEYSVGLCPLRAESVVITLPSWKILLPIKDIYNSPRRRVVRLIMLKVEEDGLNH